MTNLNQFCQRANIVCYSRYLEGERKRLLRRNLFPFTGPLPPSAIVLRDGRAASFGFAKSAWNVYKGRVLAMLSYIAQHYSSRRAATAGAPRVWNGIMARGRLQLASRRDRASSPRGLTTRRVASTPDGLTSRSYRGGAGGPRRGRRRRSPPTPRDGPNN